MYNNLTIYLGDITTEYVKAGANTNSAHIRELSNNAVQPANQFIENTWEGSYIGINRANIVIDKTEANDRLDESIRDRYVNESKFLRALFYLILYVGGATCHWCCMMEMGKEFPVHRVILSMHRLWMIWKQLRICLKLFR